MRKATRAKDFQIHVDPSCLTDSSDAKMSAKRDDLDGLMDNLIEYSTAGAEEDAQDDADQHSDSQRSRNVSNDSHTEALIQAAARAVVASMEQEGYTAEDFGFESGEEDSRDGKELAYPSGNELTYDGTRATYESELENEIDDPYDGSASSHHDDDIFSNHGGSHRSSLNSSDEQHTDDDAYIKNEKREERSALEYSGDEETLSRMPSSYSLLPEPLSLPSSSHPRTPSTLRSRPPFRSPSSVRALQMSSPAPSIFSSSRSSKRPTVSRLGTPHSQSPSKMKTPGRFKFQKECPLVLLHVTLLPLQWPHADTIEGFVGEGISRELESVKESWKLLQEKLGDTVLERGVLLPHPQDSYEQLEERLLQALELPVKPRARILTCGHYLGPEDLSSEDESDSDCEGKAVSGHERERWCDICGREVLYEECKLAVKQRRFKIKVYASNGLMRAGAWGAAWREMERVDVELEPLVEAAVAREMKEILATRPNIEEVEVEMVPEAHPYSEKDEELKRRLKEERLREIYGPSNPIHVSRALRQKHGDSLPELLFAALKVAMRDKKNILICFLSFLVLVFALRPANAGAGGVNIGHTAVVGVTEVVRDQVAAVAATIDTVPVATQEVVVGVVENVVENIEATATADARATEVMSVMEKVGDLAEAPEFEAQDIEILPIVDTKAVDVQGVAEEGEDLAKIAGFKAEDSELQSFEVPAMPGTRDADVKSAMEEVEEPSVPSVIGESESEPRLDLEVKELKSDEQTLSEEVET